MASLSSPISQTSSGVPLTSSPFGDAITDFIKFLPPKARKPAILEAGLVKGSSLGPDDVQEAALRLEERYSKLTPTKVWKYIEPVMQTLKDYGGVVDTLCQAYPMPSSLIWGSLKAVVDCSIRYVEVYGTIEVELEQLAVQLRRLKDYEQLYGKSPEMFDLLKQSYIKILKFWAVVEEECSSKGRYKKAFRALTSFNARRLREILSGIDRCTTHIIELTAVLQEKSRRSDGETISEIYSNMLEFRKEQKMQDQLRKEAIKNEALNMIRGTNDALNEHNYQKMQTQKYHQDSCSWLLSNRTFSEWFWDSSFPEIWVKAAPGTGKSILCTYAASQARVHFPHSGVLSHYFTFDEHLPVTTVYRGLAFELAKLAFEQNEVPAHVIQHIRRMSGNSGELQDLIKMLIEELPTVLIFLDGLDEEDGGGGFSWQATEQVVVFFQDLASQEDARVRLWLSSQDQKRIRNITSSLPESAILHITEADNGRAIDQYLARELLSLLVDEDEGSKNLVLKDLSEQAHGNFLWANLMFEAVRDAPSLGRIQEEIHKGLPRKHEDYYRRRMENLNISEHAFVSQILSCIAYAKRPLSVEELCEAIGMYQTVVEKDLRNERNLRPKFVLDLCSPLVEIKDIGADSARKVCVLSHASVKQFLSSNPYILQPKTGASVDVKEYYSVSEEKLAESCLKYLMQPRYEQPLMRKSDKLFTSTGEDISNHFLLAYAAKYWDKHLDVVKGTPERVKQVEKFIRSKQFRTCLQVQSLFVQGQFRLWRSTNEFRRLDVLGWRRAFPHWFIRDSAVSLRDDYYTFVREWAPFLNDVTCSRGPHPAEIDRCFWGALGSQNFLYRFHKQDRELKSFLFESADDINGPGSCRYFEKIDNGGHSIQIMRLQKVDGACYQLLCQRWQLKGRRPGPPEWDRKITVDRKGWEVYDQRLRKFMVGRPAPVDCSYDFRYLRLASSIFVQSTSGDYQKLQGLEMLEERSVALEELASKGTYLAVATRSRVSKKDLYASGFNDIAVEETNVAEFLNMIISNAEIEQSTATTSSKGKSPRSSTGDGQSATVNSSQTSTSVDSNSILDSDSEKEIDPPDSLFEEEIQEQQSELESNSAEEFWSEGSTEPQSDETDDADQWNDWGSGDDGLNLEEFDEGSEASLKIEEELPTDSDSEEGKGLKRRQPSLESSFHERFLGDDSSSSSGSEGNEGGAVLEDLLWGNRNGFANNIGPVARLEVFSTELGTAEIIFHFEQRITKALFSSPPLFHPHSPLLVWPIGGGELLFANYQENTYFTRTLRCSTPHSCHIFIKGHFSACGEYLHLASLEVKRSDAIPGQILPPLKSFLQVSTHRLSKRKTANSPPRLVFRMVVPLGESHSLPISMMPYTLIWRTEHVYISNSGAHLDVIRIPLFRSSPSSTTSNNTAQPDSLVLKQGLFLPQSALFRPVYYFPPDSQAKKRENQAMVLMGSSQGDEVLVSRKLVSSPSGVFIDEEKLGAEWQARERFGKGEDTKLTKLGARLVGRFETFDLKDDCDVVPYLT